MTLDAARNVIRQQSLKAHTAHVPRPYSWGMTIEAGDEILPLRCAQGFGSRAQNDRKGE
jgi:hypothetical protein